MDSASVSIEAFGTFSWNKNFSLQRRPASIDRTELSRVICIFIIFTKYSAACANFGKLTAIYNSSRDLLDTMANEITVSTDR